MSREGGVACQVGSLGKYALAVRITDIIMRNQNMKAWGTWYTEEGERADAWPVETLMASSRNVRDREAVVSTAVHGLASAGGGLSNVLEPRVPGGGGIASKWL